MPIAFRTCLSGWGLAGCLAMDTQNNSLWMTCESYFCNYISVTMVRKSTPRSFTKRGLRPDEVAWCVGSKKLFDEMEAAGWLIAVVQRHKLKLFDAGDVDRAWSRILSGELPNPTGAESGEI